MCTRVYIIVYIYIYISIFFSLYIYIHTCMCGRACVSVWWYGISRLMSGVCVTVLLPSTMSGKLQEASNSAKGILILASKRFIGSEFASALEFCTTALTKCQTRGHQTPLETEAAEGEETDTVGSCRISGMFCIVCAQQFNIMYHTLKCFDLPWLCGHLQSVGIRCP